jgi:hypothetical protein
VPTLRICMGLSGTGRKNIERNNQRALEEVSDMLDRSDKRLRLFFLSLLTVVAVLCYQKNFLHFAHQGFFTYFSRSSDLLVLGGIVANDRSLPKQDANLGHVTRDRGKDYAIKYPDDQEDTYAVFSGAPYTTLQFFPYKSNYGIQGVVFTQIHRLFRADRLHQLERVNSILLAVVVVALFALYRRIYDNRFAAIFLITMISSPWIVSFARSLYWSPFLWFLPALLAAMAYLKKGVVPRLLFLLGIAASVFVKSLGGYEYLSTITLFACSVFVVAPFFRSSDRDWVGNLRMSILVLAACIIGFVCALLVHAQTRGDSIRAGLKNILEVDVKRRTYGDPSHFPAANKASLESSALSVVQSYVMDWTPPDYSPGQKGYRLLAWVPGSLFKVLLLLGVFGICYQVWTRHATVKRDAVLLGSFFIVSVSWLVLAKAHSYAHVHLNYVVWYFGFVQALLYVAFNTVSLLSIALVKWAKTVTTEDF